MGAAKISPSRLKSSRWLFSPTQAAIVPIHPKSGCTSQYLPSPAERWEISASALLGGYFTKQSKDPSDKLVESIQDLMESPKIIRSVCRTPSE